MIEALFSPHWYRVKDLKPQLKKQVQLVNQEYRGQIWHVVRDPASTRSHRFSSNAYEFVRQFDGQLSVEQIWASCNQRLGDDSPSQDELIALLSKLHTADLMQSAVSPALEELLKRGEKRDKAQRNSHFKNPAALRFPLFDPDQFLERTAHWVRPAFAGLPLATIFVLVIIAAVQAGAHWSELSEAITTQALQPYNLLLLVLLYPLVKLLHELGHAYSVKLEGGEVHELGVMLLVLMPIPYVDASASSAFPERHKRVLVSAAGMIVELALSAMAMLLWLTLENGIVRDIALNIVLIGGVSTLLFNGNPLLRYDAYYMLSDSVGIPNLAQRSNQYLGYLIQRYVFGIRQARSPASAEGEAPWFVFYAISSFFYRTVLMLTISLYLAGKMFFLGVMLALWMLFTQFVLPLAKMAGFLFSDRLGVHGTRARGVTAASLAMLVLILTTVPLPSNTVHEGVVSLPGEARISSDVDAIVKRVLVTSGQSVVKGQGIIELDDPESEAKLAVESAKLRELLALQTTYRVTDTVQALAMEDKIVEAKAKVSRATEKVQSLFVTSPRDGQIAILQASDLPGSYVEQGTLLAYLMNDANARVQLVVDQADQDRIQQQVEKVTVRLSSAPNNVLQGRLAHITPQAGNALPSKVLGTAGGGAVALEQNDGSGLQSLDSLFQYELDIPLALHSAQLGTRAFVRFEHGSESLSEQIVRRTRQLFLKHFDV